MTLYHWTCAHGWQGIGPVGVLRPAPQPFLPGQPALVWLTDLEVADAYALGLQSEAILRCDRTEYRYRALVETTCVPWAEWLAANPLPPAVLSEFTMMRRPKHWWVSELPVPVEIS